MQGRRWISFVGACALATAGLVGTASPPAGAAGPVASIGDASVAETDPPLTGAATTTAFVTVRLSAPAAGGEKLRVVTSDAVPVSAIAGTDYTAVARTLTLRSGVTQVPVPVKVRADQLAEPTPETLRVGLSVVSGTISIGRASGTVTILDDDDGGASPALRIGDVTVVEGNSGFVLAKMEVDLDVAAPAPVTFRLTTVPGSATPVQDYKALAANRTIQTGKRSTVAAVKVFGDVATEPDEGFTVTVTNLAGAAPAKTVGTATILDDEIGPTSVTATVPTAAHAQSDPAPRVRGTADAGSSVDVFRSAACAGSPAATGSAATFAGTGIPVAVPRNATTVVSARATDAVGNTSCSPTSLSYTHDDIAPDRPSIDASSPPSPAAERRPLLTGTAEPGSSVAVFDGTGCDGTPVLTVPAATFASGFAVVMHANAATDLTARATDEAGNASTCSVPFTYTHDDTPPLTPEIAYSDPSNGQPRSDDHPELFGPSEPGGTVRAYPNGSCTGAPVATGSAATFTSGAGITVAVTPDATTTLTVDERDAAGNVSACSEPFAYTHDGIAPAAPFITASSPDNSSPSPDATPEVVGTAEAGTTVDLFTDGTCSGAPIASGSASAFGGTGITVGVALNAPTKLWAQLTDAAGNVSDCSAAPFTYVHDDTPPAVPTIDGSTPASPGSSTTPLLYGTSDAQTVVRLYEGETCSGLPVAVKAADTFAAPGLTVLVAADTTTFFTATATDAAGNVSSCSLRFGYTHVTAAGPAQPVITAYIGDGFTGTYVGTPPAITPFFMFFSGAGCTGPIVDTAPGTPGPAWGAFPLHTPPFTGAFAHGRTVSAMYRTLETSPCSPPFVIP